MPLLATAKVPTSKLEVGSYTVLCTGIIEDALPESKFNPEVYRLLFDVEGVKDEEGNQATTDAICSRTFSPKSKLWGWLVAFGLKPEVGKVMDLESVIGRRCMAVVEANGDYTRVGNLVPLPRGSQPTNVDDVPFDTDAPPLADALHEAAALADWTEQLRGIGYSTKEIIDHAKAKTGKALRDLSAAERDELMAEMTA